MLFHNINVSTQGDHRVPQRSGYHERLNPLAFGAFERWRGLRRGGALEMTDEARFVTDRAAQIPIQRHVLRAAHQVEHRIVYGRLERGRATQRRANEFGFRRAAADGSGFRGDDFGGGGGSTFAIAPCASERLEAHNGISAVRDRFLYAPGAELRNFQRVIPRNRRRKENGLGAGERTAVGSHWMYGSMFSEQQGFCTGLRTMTSVRVPFLS